MKSANSFHSIVNFIVLRTWQYVWNNPDMEEPPCYRSENEDGSVNFSYPRSCLYTVDNEGVLRCKEFPDEILDLNDIGTLFSLCVTIFKDITGSEKDELINEMTERAIDELFSQGSGE